LIEQPESKKENREAENDFSKKEKKRIEAEQRKKKYALTKDIKKKITDLEKRISELEKKEKELERLLLDPSIYGDHQKIMELNSEYQKVKEKLSAKLTDWEKYSSELLRIEKDFN
jgi:ATP-binding cassette, subfamily F, member 3